MPTRGIDQSQKQHPSCCIHASSISASGPVPLAPYSPSFVSLINNRTLRTSGAQFSPFIIATVILKKEARDLSVIVIKESAHRLIRYIILVTTLVLYIYVRWSDIRQFYCSGAIQGRPEYMMERPSFKRATSLKIPKEGIRHFSCITSSFSM